MNLNSQINQDGILCEPAQWSESVAGTPATMDGVPELTHDHQGIIHALLMYFGMAPPALHAACHTRQRGARCVEHLFHSGRETRRMSGMPDPGETAYCYR